MWIHALPDGSGAAAAALVSPPGTGHEAVINSCCVDSSHAYHRPVISDSIPWKDELLKIADRLEAKTVQQRWTERSGFLVERDVMVSAYAIRKLIEAYKVSDSLRDKQVPVNQFDMTGAKPPDWYTRVEFWEFYDMESPRGGVLSLRELCNQIIHSWMWEISANEHTHLFDGFFVSSDRESRKRLFFVSAGTYIERCREIGNEDIYRKEWLFGDDGQFAMGEILGRPYGPPADEPPNGTAVSH